MRVERSSRGGTEQRGMPRKSLSAVLVLGGVVRSVAVLAVVLLLGLVGCSSSTALKGTTDPPAKVRLEKLFQFYQRYAREKRKPPPNEQAFKDYIRTLPQDDKEAAGVGEDVDSFLVSPRDGQKYHIRYGMVANPGGPTRAVAWEETGKDGKRYVALSVGYVEQYDEENFKNYNKK